MIDWNNGLNIGIKVLDDEHKQLLMIVNELASAISENQTRDKIERIYNNLVKSIISHSDNEELILKHCNYADLEDHKQYHTNSINEIKLLKGEIINACGYINAQNIHKNLVELLLKHIIVEDMPLDKVFASCNLIKNTDTNYSWFERLIIKTSNTFSFTKRLLLSALIPLTGMLILGFIALWNHYDKYNEMKSTFNISHIIHDVNKLAHNIQIERGLSCAYISSKKSSFKDNLQEQYIFVNKTMHKFKNELNRIKSHKVKTIRTNINKFKADIKNLDRIRQDINTQNISRSNVITLYTDIIINLLHITSKIALINTDEDISSSILSLSSILHYKEALGLERAYVTMFIEQKFITEEEYLTFIRLLNKQKKYLSEFNQTASKKQKDMKKLLINTSKIKEIINYRSNVKDHNIQDLDSQLWFRNTTEYLNSVMSLEYKLLNEIHTLLNKNIDNTRDSLILWFIYTMLIFSTTIFIIYLFEKSSKRQINQMINAIKGLADGDRSLRITPSIIKDEMSQMQNAYEKTRQELLIADIYTQLYKNQKNAELKSKQSQNIKLEKMAFIDPLTGALNRRRFKELSELELERSIRYENNLSFLMLDIDHFKEINDTYGHAIGDEVLKHFASTCINMARNIDIIARVGGEEFIVMLPETNTDNAYIMAERFRKKISDSEIIVDDNIIKYSVSIGISVLDLSEDTNIDTILEKADKALYNAKNGGRNKTEIYNN